MASLRERVQNVFDDHQGAERERARQEGYQQALYQTRDALLGSALTLKDEWAGELARSRTESHVTVHARYEARVQGLNDAFAALRQGEPGITTQLDPREFRESATRQAQSRSHLSPELHHDHDLVFARGAHRPILDPDQYRAGYDAMKETLDRTLDAWHRSAGVEHSRETERQAVHDMALQASEGVRRNWGDRGRGPEQVNHPDCDRGQRKALMDWSHEHNHRLAVEQQRAREFERTRDMQEYGISY